MKRSTKIRISTEGLRCFSTLPRCRCPARPWITPPGSSAATAWRYVIETVALLAARAPRLRQALRDASKTGHAYLVIDGTLIPIDRVAADRPFYA